MKLATFEKRTKKQLFCRKNSRAYKMVQELLINNVTIRPCYTSGRGRNTKNMDHTYEVEHILWILRLQKGKDSIVGNDAPKGGLTGNYIKLTSNGKRKMIKG